MFVKQVTEKNEAAAKRLVETLNTDDWDTVRKVVAPNYVFHHPVGARTQK